MHCVAIGCGGIDRAVLQRQRKLLLDVGKADTGGWVLSEDAEVAGKFRDAAVDSSYAADDDRTRYVGCHGVWNHAGEAAQEGGLARP